MRVGDHIRIKSTVKKTKYAYTKPGSKGIIEKILGDYSMKISFYYLSGYPPCTKNNPMTFYIIMNDIERVYSKKLSINSFRVII